MMKFIESTKQKLGRYHLNKDFRRTKRERKSCNLGEAQKIGIIYNATHMVSFEIIKNFVKRLSLPDSKIFALGFVDSKDLIDHYLYRKGFEFFTKTDLNWYYKPVSDTVKKFIEDPFDILINLNLENIYPIEYIVALSKARFKVGKYSVDENFLDFMIDLEKEKEAMKSVRNEVDVSKKPSDAKSVKKEIEKEVDIKVDIELQLNFLINQLVHYLSIIK